MTRLEDIKDYIVEHYDGDVIVFDDPSYCKAFVGLSDDGRAVYDFEKMIESLMEEDGMEYSDAIEFIEYNTIRAIPYMGGRGPIILYPIDE